LFPFKFSRRRIIVSKANEYD